MMMQQLFNMAWVMFMGKLMLNDIPHALDDKYELIRRTKRGSLVTITREGRIAKVEVVNYEDANDLSKLLNAAGVHFTTTTTVSKSAWEGAPAYLREKRGPASQKAGIYPGVTFIFNFEDLERIMRRRVLSPLLTGEET